LILLSTAASATFTMKITDGNSVLCTAALPTPPLVSTRQTKLSAEEKRLLLLH
jgi:hypothetical protein